MGESKNINELVRIVRLGKLSKLFKFLKLLRLIKIMKQQNKIMGQMNSFMQVGMGMDRLMFFAFMLIMLCHISSCLWVICANFNEDSTDTTNWMREYGIEDLDDFSNAHRYFVSLYWTITTITTVGYGDISGNNDLERMFSLFMMIIGISCFSFLNGALASFFQSLDSSNASLNQRLNVLNKIAGTYKIPKELKRRIIRQMSLSTDNDYGEVLEMLDWLPPKLRTEVSLVIYKTMTTNVFFLKTKSDAFKSWICPLLSPKNYEDNEIIFNRNESAEMIYFF
jgi:hypothetical protein